MIAVAEDAEQSSVFCRRCKHSVSWPAAFTDSDKHALASLARESRVRAVQRLRQGSPASLGYINALVTHISGDGQLCHRCAKPVSPGVSMCENCKCLNLTW